MIETVYRCTSSDLPLVKAVLLHPDVYPFITDDGSPSAKDSMMCEVFLSNSAIYVLCPHPSMILVLIPQNYITYEVHTNITPDGRGKEAIERLNKATAWMFANTPCRKIITLVPTFNRPAKWMARRFGMKEEGINRQSFQKSGRIFDQIIFGFTREEWLCRQQQ